MNASYAVRSTRIRDRAQQSCPALSNTADGALAAAASRSASAKTTLALLPPELQGDRLDLRRAPGHHPLAHRTRSGEDDLAHIGMLHQSLAHHRPGAGQHLEHVLGDAGIQGQFGQAQRGERRQLGGLEHHGVSRGQRRGEAPRGDRHREVPGDDRADHADRFVKGDVQPVGHRESAGRSAAREPPSNRRSRPGRCPPPSGRRRWCGLRWPPRAGPDARGRRRPLRRNAATGGPGRREPRGARPRTPALARATASSVASTSSSSTVVTTCSLAGLITS